MHIERIDSRGRKIWHLMEGDRYLVNLDTLEEGLCVLRYVSGGSMTPEEKEIAFKAVRKGDNDGQ